jgi:hypothetical protein
MSEIKVGDTLWSDFDSGRHRWISDVITGETKMSWIVGADKYTGGHKVNKKTMREAMGAYSPRRWFTVEDARDERFRRRYAHEIGARVSGQSASTLRKVAELIGFVAEESEA